MVHTSSWIIMQIKIIIDKRKKKETDKGKNDYIHHYMRVTAFNLA